MKKGWENTTLGKVCPITNRKVGEFVGERPYFATGAVGPEGELSDAKYVSFATRPSRAGCMPEAGDVGFARMKGTKKVILVNETLKGALFSTGFCFLAPRSDIDPQFLFYFVTSDDFQNEKNKVAGVGIMGGIKNADAAQIQIPIPPLHEQQRIVGILGQAFAAIATAKVNAEKNLNNAKELFESYLQSIFENKGEGWEEKTLGEVCSLITDGKHGDCENEANSGYYFLSAKDVRNNTLLFENARQITKSGFEETHRRTNLKPGDICMVNTGATIGRISFASDNPKTFKTTFQKSVAVIKTIPSLINNHYCCYVLKSDLKKLVKVSSGTAVPNLLLGDLKRHKINLPKSLAEQQTIVKKLDMFSAETQTLELIYQKKIAGFEELKKSVLQRAFNGELAGACS